MRPFLLPLMLASVAALTASAQRTPSQAPASVRVLTFNVRHGEGWDGIVDISRAAAVIREERADLVALQEVDQGTLRVGGVRQADQLIALTGLHGAFGKAMDYQGGEYGVAILSRWPLRRTWNQPLPQADGYESRTLLSVEVDPFDTGHPIVFSTTHLDQGRESPNRLAQVNAINERLGAQEAPGILAGDFNSRYDTGAMTAIRTLWRDMWIEPPPADPNARPRYKVDYILARPAERWRAIEARAVEAAGVSDHRAILVVMELDGIS
jgi:endonuclease/exonuclease/phosphatase family metal-dependent hydrolase